MTETCDFFSHFFFAQFKKETYRIYRSYWCKSVKWCSKRLKHWLVQPMFLDFVTQLTNLKQLNYGLKILLTRFVCISTNSSNQSLFYPRSAFTVHFYGLYLFLVKFLWWNIQNKWSKHVANVIRNNSSILQMQFHQFWL